MIVVLQRVHSGARVRVDGEVVGAIEGAGLVVLLGVLAGDTEREALALAERTARYRVFQDDEGRMNRSLLDVGGGALLISQFTLAADGRKGRRPSFDRAAPPAEAGPLYERFAAHLTEFGVASVATGRFGALMEVEFVNHGPATFLLEQ
ncbi:D-tyrosyl-tRNA(Tyr) deacylase [Planctomycetes bacterium Pla163]|uniref:D-aminoacyl-tRNA deacylase n=1 Tax=Rohdeia mirabilis TaxID=2528008 RepID=A0A518D2Z1_9BACT|nr:D-tyrosyl-tRNA(Tyr) deacylase [Planctomycetes bacterium Pla163]